MSEPKQEAQMQIGVDDDPPLVLDVGTTPDGVSETTPADVCSVLTGQRYRQSLSVIADESNWMDF